MKNKRGVDTSKIEEGKRLIFVSGKKYLAAGCSNGKTVKIHIAGGKTAMVSVDNIVEVKT